MLRVLIASALLTSQAWAYRPIEGPYTARSSAAPASLPSHTEPLYSPGRPVAGQVITIPATLDIARLAAFGVRLRSEYQHGGMVQLADSVQHCYSDAGEPVIVRACLALDLASYLLEGAMRRDLGLPAMGIMEFFELPSYNQRYTRFTMVGFGGSNPAVKDYVMSSAEIVLEAARK